MHSVGETATTWTATGSEAASLRSEFDRAPADAPDAVRRRELSDALALGMARVRAEQDGKRLSEDLAARHVVAEQMVFAPWRRSQGLGDAATLVLTGAPIDDELATFLSAVGLPVTSDA